MLWNLLIRSTHMLCLREPSISGAHKYFEGNLLIWKLSSLAMWLCTTSGVLKKIIWYLSLLISIPKAREKLSKTCDNPLTYWVIGAPMHIVLSMNCWCDNWRSYIDRHRPFIFFLEIEALSALLSPSIARMMSKGERGLTWWIPREAEKGLMGEPFGRINKKGLGNESFDPTNSIMRKSEGLKA